MKKHEYVIGIDPDCEKSGVALLHLKSKKIEVFSMPFPALIDYLKESKEILPEFVVVVEAGWMNESNWHTNSNQSHRVSAAIGNKTGRNHETGRKIVEICKHYGIEVIEQKPLKKYWKGPEGKVTHDEISYFIPGFPSRSNQETRDATLLVWNYYGFGITIRINRKNRTVSGTDKNPAF